MKITNEMVENACRAAYPGWDEIIKEAERVWKRKQMHSALSAALQSAADTPPSPYAHALARVVANLNPEEATDDRILRDIHLRLQTWGEKDAERMVSVFHRNLVLWAVVKSIDAAVAATATEGGR